MSEQLCLLCWRSPGIDEENSYPAEGPSDYSAGDPGWIEPCICQYAPVSCVCCGETWYYDQPACLAPDCDTHDWDDDRWRKETEKRFSC